MAKNKVCVVGGDSGVVGMATRDLLLAQGFDVVTSDRPETSENQADRQAKREKYDILKERADLDDFQQAEWLKKQLPTSVGAGQKTEATLTDAVTGGAEIVVITSGLPRGTGEGRSALMLKNEPIFETYGTEIARAYLKNPEKPFPKIVVVGNPVDSMTEVTYKQAKLVLKNALTQETDESKKAAIEATLENLSNLVLGQGGILDGARAASAIKKTLGVDTTSVPVLGTHNDNMVIDYSHVIPTISPVEEQKEAIHKLTREGGTEIAKDILKKTSEHDPKTNEVTKEGIKQSAFLGTAAATAIMVRALVSEKSVQLPVSHHGEVSGATLGRMCDVSKNGAVITDWKADTPKGRAAYLDARGASRDLADAKAKAASQKASSTPS